MHPFVPALTLTTLVVAQDRIPQSPGVENDWWAFRPLATVAAPRLPDQWRRFSRGPIDDFVLAELRTRGLRPSPPADRRTLLRRVTFDLTGLPPDPEQVEAFATDERGDAYQRAVDRLLASPRYAERWARHWLDVVHYADTHGYDKDKPRKHAWPYRDWVIDALARDMPWAEFVSRQIAGDVLHPDEPDSVVATGMLAAGPWDFVGHVELREGTVDKAKTRNLDRDDVVTNVFGAFQSVTVQCARCHDHKFDPITQAEYYDLQAVVRGRRARRSPVRRRSSDRAPARGAARRTRATATSAAGIPPTTRRALRRRRAARIGGAAPGAGRFRREAAAARPPRFDGLPQRDRGDTRRCQMGADRSSARRSRSTPWWLPRATRSTAAIRGRASACRTCSNSASPCRRTVPGRRSRSGAATQCRRGTAMSRSASRSAPHATEHATCACARRALWRRTDDYCFALAELQVICDGRETAHGKQVTALDTIEAGGRWGRQRLVDGVRPWSHAMAERAQLEAAWRRLHDQLETAAERDRRELRTARLAAIQAEVTALPERSRVYAIAHTFAAEGSFTPPPGNRPRAVHRLERGDVTRPRERSAPGALAAAGHAPGRFDLDDPEDEGRRRAALAAWIVHPDNPLTWRSIVNRVWQYHFGRGLAASPNDFGRMGEPPSHPRLLDYLARRFRDQGGSLKALHRAIVLSATYRQSSRDIEANTQHDQGNRWLWRGPRRRLEAEALRDAILAVAGDLDLSMGGPGFRLFGFENDHSPRYLYSAYDPADPTTHRRSIYRFVVRSVPDPWLTTFDCADPSTCTPVRSQTTTPLQALALFNDRFVLHEAGNFAARARTDDPKDPLGRAVRLAWQRMPTADERARLQAHAANHGLAAVCRVLLNTNEFLHVD